MWRIHSGGSVLKMGKEKQFESKLGRKVEAESIKKKRNRKKKMPTKQDHLIEGTALSPTFPKELKYCRICGRKLQLTFFTSFIKLWCLRDHFYRQMKRTS